MGILSVARAGYPLQTPPCGAWHMQHAGICVFSFGCWKHQALGEACVRDVPLGETTPEAQHCRGSVPPSGARPPPQQVSPEGQ